MQTTTPRSPSFIGQDGWFRSSGLRLPKPALSRLSYTLKCLVAALGISPRTYRLSGDCSRAELHDSVEALQPSCDAGPLLRRLASPAKPGCAVRGVSIPGGRIVAPPSAAQPPRAIGHAMKLGAARHSSLTGSAKWIRTTIERINSALPCRIGHRGICELVDPLGLEPRPNGLRDRCAAVTPRVSGNGGGSCIPIIGFGDPGSAVELRPYEKVERAARIELASSVWKTVASPFGQTRKETLVGALGLAPRRSLGTTVLQTAAIAALPNAERNVAPR